MSTPLVALYTIVRKEIIRIFRIWSQTLLPPAITQILYFLIFGAFIGSQLSNIGGVSYIAFIVPGLVMMAIITNSFQNVVSSFFQAKFMKSIEELLIAPTPNWVILLGFVLGGMIRGLLVGLIVSIICLIFVQPIQINNIFIILLFATLTALLFSLGGFFNSLFAKSFDDISIIPTFVLTPLTYLGGVFYSIESLPPVWQVVSKFNPIVYMVDGFRQGFYGRGDFNIWLNFGIVGSLCLVMIGVNFYLLNTGRGLRQ